MNTISAIIPTVPATGLINGFTSHEIIRININVMIINDKNVAIFLFLQVTIFNKYAINHFAVAILNRIVRLFNTTI